MTARRDLAALEAGGEVRRTHGGAVPPSFSGNEDSFQRRLEENVAAKKRLATAAASLLTPGETIFLDSSTTAYYVAEKVLRERLRVTILTNSLPVMDLLRINEVPNVELVGIGGSLRKLTLSFVGPHAVATVRAHFADKVFMSAKGITPDGHLTDPDLLEVEVKRSMIRQAQESLVLLEGSKFRQRGLNSIAHVTELDLVLAADVPFADLEALNDVGATVRRV